MSRMYSPRLFAVAFAGAAATSSAATSAAIFYKKDISFFTKSVGRGFAVVYVFRFALFAGLRVQDIVARLHVLPFGYRGERFYQVL